MQLIDETARHYIKKDRVDPDARVVRAVHLFVRDHFSIGANRRVFVDWSAPEPGEKCFLSIPSIDWFSSRHNLLLDFGRLELFFEFRGRENPLWRFYSWYGPGLLPKSSFMLAEAAGGCLKVSAACLMKPSEDGWTLALRVNNFSRQKFPAAALVLKGIFYCGRVRGSVFDPINSPTKKRELFCGDVTIRKGRQSLGLENSTDGVFLDFTAGRPWAEISAVKEITPNLNNPEKNESLRQAIKIKIRQKVDLFPGTEQEFAFTWRFGNRRLPEKKQMPVNLSLLEKSCRTSWQKKLFYLNGLETPSPQLTEALKRSITYAAGCFVEAGKGKVMALANPYEFPVDCLRDTYAMSSLLQYVEPEISRCHLERLFCELIPIQGLGVSYAGKGGRSQSHRLLDLAVYPFLELWRFRQIVGRDKLDSRKMRKAVQDALDELFGFAANSAGGLVTSTHRSSDEACVFPIFVPGNILLVCALEKIAPLLVEIYRDQKRSRQCLDWAEKLRRNLKESAVVSDPEFGRIWAFEIDGKDKCLFYDQADYPNLLTMPYFGFCPKNDRVYQNTRNFIFSRRNAGYRHTMDGRYATLCDGSKQDPEDPWALGIMGELMSAPSPEQARRTYDWLETALTPGLMLSEIVDKHSGLPLGRPFGWATALMGTLFVEIICGFRPQETRVQPCLPAGWTGLRSPQVFIRGHKLVLECNKRKTVLFVDGRKTSSLDISRILKKN